MAYSYSRHRDTCCPLCRRGRSRCRSTSRLDNVQGGRIKSLRHVLRTTVISLRIEQTGVWGRRPMTPIYVGGRQGLRSGRGSWTQENGGEMTSFHAWSDAEASVPFVFIDACLACAIKFTTGVHGEDCWRWTRRARHHGGT